MPKKPKLIKTSEIPYLSNNPKDGRKIPLLIYFDTEKSRFNVFIPQSGGQILEFSPDNFVDGVYIAKSAARIDLDYRLEFLEIIIQHFTFDDILDTFRDIEQDILNSLASIHQYFVLLFYANQYKDFADALMLRNLVEYSFANHRAFYDLLHKIICTVHRTFGGNVPSLKDSFEVYATKSRLDLKDKYHFPTPIVEFYKSHEEHFLKFRYVRNNIFHHGHSPDPSFTLNDGFAYRVDDRFSQKLGDLNLWPKEMLKYDNLGSVLAILAKLSNDMFEAATDLSKCLLESFNTPPEAISPEFKIYLRSSVIKHLFSLNDYIATHWYDPKSVLITNWRVRG